MGLEIDIRCKFIGNSKQLADLKKFASKVLRNETAKSDYNSVRYSEFFGIQNPFEVEGDSIIFSYETDKDDNPINTDTCRVLTISYYSAHSWGYVGSQFVERLLENWNGRAEYKESADMWGFLAVYEDGVEKRFVDFEFNYDLDSNDNIDSDAWLNEGRDQYVIAELPPEPGKHMV